jgi:dTDP-4-dehydrorhamnose reductase
MKNLLITGANGQVGQALKQLEQDYPMFRFITTDRLELDISQPEAIAAFFSTNKPDACINCAAYTAVDKAESEQQLATLINVKATEWLAMACSEYDIPFIHFSTDYVYHSTHNRPFVETDATSPKSIYAQTKLQGSLAALAANPKTMIIRTSWVYSYAGHNFVKTMLRLGQERDQLHVVYDQVGTPTYAGDIARACLDVLQHIFEQTDDQPAYGVYHFSNEGVCSWYDFALAIFELTGTDCQVMPILSSQYPTAAARPPYSVLDKQKIKSTFGLVIPHWRTSLKACLQALQKMYSDGPNYLKFN